MMLSKKKANLVSAVSTLQEADYAKNPELAHESQSPGPVGKEAPLEPNCRSDRYRRVRFFERAGAHRAPVRLVFWHSEHSERGDELAVPVGGDLPVLRYHRDLPSCRNLAAAG